MGKSNKLFLAFIFGLLSGCSHKRTIKKLTIHQKENSQINTPNLSPNITIWIHGTRFIRRPVFHGFFKSSPGLKLAKDLDEQYYLRQLADMLCVRDPAQFDPDWFYLFGWSGKLRNSVREQAGTILYSEIIRIANLYEKKYGKTPFIRIITHSHGGTVALHLAKVNGDNPVPFVVDELVLLACPVQQNTCKFIEHDIFDHTFSIYSSLDMVQILAPQVSYNMQRTKKGHLRSRMHWPPFSYRRFQEHPKLAQIKIKINGRALFHSEFTGPRFLTLFPHVLHVMNSWRKYKATPHSTHLLCVYTHTTQEYKEKFM